MPLTDQLPASLPHSMTSAHGGVHGIGAAKPRFYVDVGFQKVPEGHLCDYLFLGAFLDVLAGSIVSAMKFYIDP